MTVRQYRLFNAILAIIAFILAFELIRDSLRAGDFVGYVNAGNLVLNGDPIYSDFLNTWPPFFSIFSVLLALVDSFNSFLIRFIWLGGSIVAMYGIVQLSLKLLLNTSIKSKKNPEGILIQDLIVVVPILISLRFIMDNMANVQINIYILYCSLLAVWLFKQGKMKWVGFLLAFTISLKVYTIFLLFYFIFKREYKVMAYSLIFLLLINGSTLLFYGLESGLHNFSVWMNEIAPRSFTAHHKNQSLFGMMLRLFSAEPTGMNLSINILSLPAEIVKRLTYVVVILAAVFPAYLLRKKITDKGSLHAIIQYSIVFTAIPVLTPLSWKAYFIFLWLPYFLLYILLFRSKVDLPSANLSVLKGLYFISILLLVFSTESFVGGYFSDVLETYSALTFGTLILLGMQLFLVQNSHRLDTAVVEFMKSPN